MQPFFAASAALLLAILGHAVGLRAGARHLSAYGISLAVGICAALATALLLPGEDAVGSAAIAVLLFCAWWFVFLNFFQSSQSSLRVNILRHIAVHGGRLERSQLFIKYNDDALIRLRIERLVQGGGIVERDGRYFVASGGLRMLARFFWLLKMLIMGRPSEFH
jgi:hypothetical protein